MKRRVLSLLLAGAMAAGGSFGYGVNVKAEEEKELTTVRILCKNDVTDTIKVENWENYSVPQVVVAELEEIGIRLELETIDNTSFANVVATRMASGVDLPDLVAYAWEDVNKILEWADSGLVYALDDLLEEYDEDGSIKAFYDRWPGAWNSKVAPDGKLYWFSYIIGELGAIDQETGEYYVKSSPHTLSVRKDWVEAIGEELQNVYTPETLFDLLKKLSDEDANGNGRADEVIDVSISGFDNSIARAFGLSSNLLGGYLQSDNIVFSNFYHENFPAYIEYMQSLYENGLWDTASLGANSMQVENRVSALSGYAQFDYEAQLSQYGDVQYMPIYLDPDGDLTNGFSIKADTPGPTTYCSYFIPTACKNPEAVIRLMDYVYTDEYALLDRFGVEGIGYEVNENGNYVRIIGDNSVDSPLFNVGFGAYVLPSLYIYPIVQPVYLETDAEYMKPKKEWYYNYTMQYRQYADVEYSGQELSLPSDEELEIISEKETVLKTYASELLTDLILGNKSLDKLEEYQSELKALGLQDYLDMLQARRNRMLGVD